MNLLKYLPCTQLTILSKKSQDELNDLLEKHINKHPQGAEVKIVMRLHLLVLGFTAIYAFGMLRIIFATIIRNNYLSLPFLEIFILIWLIFWQIYKSEAAEAERTLIKLFSL